MVAIWLAFSFTSKEATNSQFYTETESKETTVTVATPEKRVIKPGFRKPIANLMNMIATHVNYEVFHICYIVPW